MRSHTINEKVKASIGDAVYLVADDKQERYMVVGYTISPTSVLYRLSNANSTYYAYDFEFTDTKDYSL